MRCPTYANGAGGGAVSRGEQTGSQELLLRLASLTRVILGSRVLSYVRGLENLTAFVRNELAPCQVPGVNFIHYHEVV